MSDGGPDEVLSASKVNKCPVCEIYQRKIEELEQRLSGREAIISLLQARLKRCEGSYQKLFDDFEKLRFEHCTALQENYSLKEINSKLEEDEFKTKFGKRVSQRDQNVSASFHIKDCPSCGLSEVTNIERLVNTQDEALKELIDKIVNELNFCKCAGSEKSENFTETENGDHLDNDPQVQNLLSQIKNLKVLLEQYKQENDTMKQMLTDKKNSLTECQNLLESTSRSINEISYGIHNIVKNNVEKKSSEGRCCEIKDLDVSAIDPEVEYYKNKLAQVESTLSEMQEKEKEYEYCRCRMMTELNNVSNNNQILSDTLDIIKAENINNLDIIAKLKEELRTLNEECETKQTIMKSKITELEDELEASVDNEKKLKESLDNDNEEIKKLKDRMKLLIEENKSCSKCKSEMEDVKKNGSDLNKRVIELDATIDEINKDLEEKMLELTEFEEENRALGQKVECLTGHNNNLQQRIIELEDQLYEKSQELQKRALPDEMSSDFRFKDLEQKMSKLEEKNKFESGRNSKNDLARKEGENLKNCLKCSISELEDLKKENENLKEQVQRQKSENKKETEKLQALVDHSQWQVDLLVKEHDEKTAQIQAVANELDSIRRNVTEENNNLMAKMEQLEGQRDALKKQLEEYEINTCSCAARNEEIERLKMEIFKKQGVIQELEQALDNFNVTMKQLERNIVDLGRENACLKTEKDRYIQELEDLQTKMTEKIRDVVNIKGHLEDIKIISENYKQDRERFKIENDKLQSEIGTLFSERDNMKRNLENENLKLKKELGQLKAEHSRLAMDSQELDIILKAYEELKGQYSEKRLENEKLKTEMDNIKEHCDKVGKDSAKKSLHIEDLKAEIEDSKHTLEGLKEKLKEKENNLYELREQYNELKKNYDRQQEEIRKIKKQYESCSKQSQISRDEYNNLRREYKQIKSMLSEQIKKYRSETSTVDVTPTLSPTRATKPCKVIGELKRILVEKENQMSALQQKLEDSSYEIIELKDYVHKLIADNNILKSAINNLIGNLERKIKGPSFGNLSENSADVIAGEILESLTNIESIILNKGQTGCLPICTDQDCNCMEEIQSQYNNKKTKPIESQPGSSGGKTGSINSCGSKSNPTSTGSSIVNRLRPPDATAHLVSDPSSTTTDSEECHCTKFLDKGSLEFLKDAIQGLKSSKNCTNKEKSIDCEPYR